MCACGSLEPTLQQNNLLKIVQLLLAKSSDPKMDVSSCDKYCQTPLMYACRTGNHFLIDCLVVQYGADVDAKDDNSWTVCNFFNLNWALLFRHLILPFFLLEFSACFKQRPSQMCSKASTAQRRRYHSHCRLLLPF